MTRVTNEELAASLDELFGQLAEIADRQEALYQLIANRDKHYLKLGAHLERLLAKDREQMRALGILKLVERANAAGDKFLLGRCPVSGCDGLSSFAGGYCSKHADMVRLVDDPLKAWNGKCAIAGCTAFPIIRDPCVGPLCYTHADQDHPARKAAPLFEKIAASPLMKGNKP